MPRITLITTIGTYFLLPQHALLKYILKSRNNTEDYTKKKGSTVMPDSQIHWNSIITSRKGLYILCRYNRGV
jgi:hypothetical protein